MKTFCAFVCLLLAATALPFHSNAASIPAPADITARFQEEMFFPADAGVINVKAPPYNAKGDGVTDDTRAIQQAISDHMKGAILYFPKGTYLISDTLKWSKKNSKGEECWGNFTFQGQSTRGTVLRLKDGVFRDPAQPRSIMWCGGFGSADWFHNYVKNITFSTGRDNPGAVGLQFYSNNSGAVRDVEIRSEDGSGVCGLDLAHRDMNGPLLVSRVRITGFATGIKTGHSVNSQVFEHVLLEGQREYGFHNDGQSISIRGLVVRGAPLAMRNSGPAGFLTIVDSELTREGSPRGSAIDNHSPMFARNIRTRGFVSVCQTTRGTFTSGDTIHEWVSEPVITLFDSPKRSLDLPVKETPHLPYEPLDRWVNVQKFHRGGDDYSPAIQAAIDSGATTIYFPRGAYKIGATVLVRGNVQRLVGLNSWFAEAPNDEFEDGDVPRFRIEDGAAPVVIMENFSGGFSGRPFVDYATKRSLVLKESDGVPSNFRGSGEVFLEDITGSPGGIFLFDGPQRVWARQFNVEAHVNPKFPSTLENRGSTIWILGLKTEQGNRLVATRNGGFTEILGGLVYTVTGHEGRPAFINEDSSMSLSLLERCYMDSPMNPAIRETRDGVTRELGKQSILSLYAGFREDASARYLQYPSGAISNEHALVRFYRPDPLHGYYRGTRFEWSGLVPEVLARGHRFFCEFRPGHDPYNHDDVCGTAEEFDIRGPAGFAAIPAGGAFLKIGVGMLEKPDDAPYAFTRRYRIVDGGRWEVQERAEQVVFRHHLDASAACRYEYIKTLRLDPGSPMLRVERQLINRGDQPLVTEHYGHNFLQIDGRPAGPGYRISFPFTPRLLEGGQTHDTLELDGRACRFLREVPAGKAVWFALEGFGTGAEDHQFTITNCDSAASVVLRGDRALNRFAYYSSDGVLCPEPFVSLSIPPGQTAHWSTTYEFVTEPR